MHRRPQPLAPGAGGNWFAVDVPERGPHAMRVPRSLGLRALMDLVVSTQPGEPGAVQAALVARDVGAAIRVRASEESLGACIGACWRHATLALDSERHAFPDTASGLRRFGDAVLDELVDAGYTDDQIKAIIEGVMERLVSAAAPKAEEVALRAEQFRDG